MKKWISHLWDRDWANVLPVIGAALAGLMLAALCVFGTCGCAEVPLTPAEQRAQAQARLETAQIEAQIRQIEAESDAAAAPAEGRARVTAGYSWTMIGLIVAGALVFVAGVVLAWWTETAKPLMYSVLGLAITGAGLTLGQHPWIVYAAFGLTVAAGIGEVIWWLIERQQKKTPPPPVKT